jgi:hypothetical protein
MAQTLLTVASVQISAGITRSNSFVVPASGFSFLDVSFVIAALDLASNKTLELRVLTQVDGIFDANGANGFDCGFIWQGPTNLNTKNLGQPTMRVPLITLAGQTCQLWINASALITVGAVVSAV